MTILAVDPASRFGWAITPTLYGVWDLRTRKDESMGMKLIRLRAKLDELYSINKFQVIVYERPAGRYTHAIIHQAKLIAVIEEWCEENKVEYRAYSAKEIKKFSTGNGGASKEKVIKAAQEQLGYKGKDDNEADALWLLQLARHELGLEND